MTKEMAINILRGDVLGTNEQTHEAVFMAIRALKEQARVDAVPVVRCKDCIHKPTGSGANHNITFPDQDYRCPCRCEDYWYSWMPDDNWFCANGERRKDEND